MTEPNKNPKNPFFNVQGVYKRSYAGLKDRLEALIHDKGFSVKQFRDKIGIDRKYWWLIVHEKQEASDWLKIKIAKELETDSLVLFNPIKSREVENEK